MLRKTVPKKWCRNRKRMMAITVYVIKAGTASRFFFEDLRSPAGR